MVIPSNETITAAGVNKLVEYAHAGLPIIFLGGIPSNYSGYNPQAATAAVKSLQSLKYLHNVHVVSNDGLASTLQSLNIQPRTAVTSNGTWYTYWREDETTSTDYIYIYNDAAGLSFEQSFSVGNISFETTGKPYLYNAWTGDMTPVSIYQQTKTHVTIPLQVAGNQSIIVAFHQDSQNEIHASNTAAGVIGTEASTNSLTILRSFDEQSRVIGLSTGKSATLTPMLSPSFTLSNWTLTVESWTPPSDIYNVEAGPQRTNSTYQIPTLIPWSEISSNLANVSGIGYYSTTFDWPPPSATNTSEDVSGAYIDLGAISHTARVTINGQILPPVDLTWARSDIGSFLRNGENTVEVVVSTPLGNVLRLYWDEIMTSGKLAAAAVPDPPSEAAYGLVFPVNIVLYRKDQVA